MVFAMIQISSHILRWSSSHNEKKLFLNLNFMFRVAVNLFGGNPMSIET